MKIDVILITFEVRTVHSRVLKIEAKNDLLPLVDTFRNKKIDINIKLESIQSLFSAFNLPMVNN